MVNALPHLMRAGCDWRMLPHDIPPRQTVYRWSPHLRKEWRDPQ
ncbi:transposase (plasmid) [Ralstonia solanacearum]|nr:IS5/IS1182 family transposase [Ralstonia solanacearum]MBX9430982.1 transposase [Ralstonia pseudosolanacearum]QUP60292.1 IS5/IS1182 family transposase [Ralstonia nicotianae]CAD17739.1 probable transposase fragment protein [Ralstonia pseudosolanacearum GMI1000]MCK4119919.1 transposase [Ralstonia pseudosolanacearum]